MVRVQYVVKMDKNIGAVQHEKTNGSRIPSGEKKPTKMFIILVSDIPKIYLKEETSKICGTVVSYIF